MYKLKDKTVGIVANSTWNIYNFRLNLIDLLITEGARVLVFAPLDEYISYKKKYPTVQHVPLRFLKRDSTNPFREVAFLTELCSKYRQHHLDALIHYTIKPNIYGAIGAYLNRVPSIAVVTGLGYAFIHPGPIRSIVKVLYWFSSKLHKKVIFENEEDCAYFADRGLISQTKGISVKGCGVDTEYFAPMKNGLFPGKIIFTFIGRLLYDKGIREFVEASREIKKKLKNVECWVVGEIDKKNPSSVNERDLINWLKDNTITYHGSVKDVRPYIANSDCVVLPSYREAIARSLTESMSMERPVICSDVAGCRETVDHGVEGFIVPPGNSQALARMMEEFVHLDEKQRHRMGVMGRKKAKAMFENQIIANQIAEIVSDIII